MAAARTLLTALVLLAVTCAALSGNVGSLRRLKAPPQASKLVSAKALGLRGGSAEMAATEEEELKLCPALAEATPDPSGVRSEQQLSEHLAAVEANPGDYIAHPEPDSLRFKLCDAAIVAQAPTGLASASIELPVSRLRNAWQRFYPLDLAVLLPDVLDTEEVFDEEGEMGQARTLAATAAVSGAVTSVVTPWAWATQKVTFTDNTTGTARLLFAQESAGVLMWSVQRGEEEPLVERVHISEKTPCPRDSSSIVRVTWTSVTSEALRHLPESRATPQGGAAAETSDASEDAVSRIRAALAQLLKMVGGASSGDDLQLKLFSQTATSDESNAAAAEDGSGNVLVLDDKTNTWGQRDTSQLRVGDVVKVIKAQTFPADLLLLHASSPTEVCIETSCFDNDTSLRHWQCVPGSLTSHDMAAAASGSGEHKTLLDALGSGDGTKTQQLRDANLTLSVRASRIAAEWDTWQAEIRPSPQEASKGVAPLTFSYRQLLPCKAKLLVTDWVVGVVLFQGADTCVELSGGARGCVRAARRLALQQKHEAALKETKKLKHFADEATRAPLDPAAFEEETQIRWKSCFTDVPDDGNCLMHAVWLGLSSLLKLYPALALPDEPPLPSSAVAFRTEAIRRMRSDSAYKEAVGNQLLLWVSIECDLLFGLEDFYCLPPEFQSLLIEYNQQVQMAGMDPGQIDMQALVDQYINTLTQQQLDGDRAYYLPLGELEIDALCRLFHIRLQVIKTEAIDVIIEGQAKHSPPVPHQDKVAVEEKILPLLDKIKAEVSPWESAREALDTVVVCVFLCAAMTRCCDRCHKPTHQDLY